nr:hypothetical protein [Pandoravirus massiliensis]
MGVYRMTAIRLCVRVCEIPTPPKTTPFVWCLFYSAALCGDRKTNPPTPLFLSLLVGHFCRDPCPFVAAPLHHLAASFLSPRRARSPKSGNTHGGHMAFFSYWRREGSAGALA